MQAGLSPESPAHSFSPPGCEAPVPTPLRWDLMLCSLGLSAPPTPPPSKVEQGCNSEYRRCGFASQLCQLTGRQSLDKFPTSGLVGLSIKWG